MDAAITLKLLIKKLDGSCPSAPTLSLKTMFTDVAPVDSAAMTLSEKFDGTTGPQAETASTIRVTKKTFAVLSVAVDISTS